MTKVKRADGKVVGEIQGQTLYKEVLGSRHFLGVPPGIAFDVTIIDKARRAGVVNLEVKDRETLRVYSTTLERFDKYAFPVSRGHGEQLGLAFTYWKVSS